MINKIKNTCNCKSNSKKKKKNSYQLTLFTGETEHNAFIKRLGLD